MHGFANHGAGHTVRFGQLLFGGKAVAGFERARFDLRGQAGRQAVGEPFGDQRTRPGHWGILYMKRGVRLRVIGSSYKFPDRVPSGFP